MNVVAVGRAPPNAMLVGAVVPDATTSWRDGETTGAFLTCEWKHDQLPVRSGRMADSAWRQGTHTRRLLVSVCGARDE